MNKVTNDLGIRLERIIHEKDGIVFIDQVSDAWIMENSVMPSGYVSTGLMTFDDSLNTNIIQVAQCHQLF